MENIVKENSIINISLDKAYNSNEDFWADNQALVYSKIIEIFNKFRVSEEDSFGMTVATKIDGNEQKIYFGFAIKDTNTALPQAGPAGAAGSMPWQYPTPQPSAPSTR